MGDKYLVRQIIPDPDRRDDVQSQKGKVRQVVLIQWFIPEMGMNESEPPESLSSEGMIGKFGDKDPLCISYNDMRDITGPRNQNANLTADLRR